MKSKTLTSFERTLGFATAQKHTFLFSSLIFTVALVGISFATGSNELYGYLIRDISYSDSNNIKFSIIIALCAFIFAAFTFKPFMARNESDTFLSLPIKKSRMIIIQVIFGICCIILSSFLSFGVIYPAINLTKYADISLYLTSLSSIFFEIVIPVIIFYLISVSLIMFCGNFFSSALYFASFCIINYFCGAYINEFIGFGAYCTDAAEITNAYQPFFYSSAMFLPTRFIRTLLQFIFPLTESNCNFYILTNIINAALLILAAVLTLYAAKTVVLGNLLKPFAPVEIIKSLPIAVIICLPSAFISSVPVIVSILLPLIAAIVVFVVRFIIAKNLKRAVFTAVMCLIIALIPQTAVFMDGVISDKITYDLPAQSNIKAVFFDPIAPVTTTMYNNNDYGEGFESVRYKFTSNDAIKLIRTIHADILAKMKETGITKSGGYKTDEELLISPGSPLAFDYDDYELYKLAAELDEEPEEEELSDYEKWLNNYGYDDDEDEYDDSSWGLFDESDVEEEYWSYLFDYDMNIDIIPVNSLSVVGGEYIDFNTEEQPKYTATIYYLLTDGRFVKRMYNNIPYSWIADDLSKLLTNDEYISLSTFGGESE